MLLRLLLGLFLVLVATGILSGPGSFVILYHFESKVLLAFCSFSGKTNSRCVPLAKMHSLSRPKFSNPHLTAKVPPLVCTIAGIHTCLLESCNVLSSHCLHQTIVSTNFCSLEFDLPAPNPPTPLPLPCVLAFVLYLQRCG